VLSGRNSGRTAKKHNFNPRTESKKQSEGFGSTFDYQMNQRRGG
jgi:hypothetical protein